MFRSQFRPRQFVSLASLLLLLGCSQTTDQPDGAPLAVEKDKPRPTTPTPPRANTQAITEIRLNNNGETVTLQRTGTRWLLPNHRQWAAEQTFVRGLLNGLDSLAGAEPVGLYPKEAAHFGFNKTNEVTFLDKTGKTLFRVAVGAATNDQHAAFIRINDGPTIFEAAAPWFANTHRPTWGNRTCWQVPASLLTSVRLQTGGETTVNLKKTEQGWQDLTPNPMKITPQFEAGVLPKFAHIRAGGLHFNPETLRGRKPIAQLTITAAQAEMTLVFFEGESGDWLAGYRQGYPVVFLFDRNFLQRATTMGPTP
ncbi:DUF4340 domain-containing protein [Acanthopleuribacter pedis]|uniref:DUF4340 domain-containing protein n=1 Tax=Acanthopleuribacter pedis TaxID=442870 RepID=A0A8J7U3V0_9BACT|nr:DUF4340 domain-containing protein [Acanthopleuribacter pedis]MBO1319982.1 DUF4340 domain-containing protein [Acanthopleuribacter pedis]